VDIIPLNRCQTSVIQTRRGGYRFWGPEAYTVFGVLFQKKRTQNYEYKIKYEKIIFI
jgi:hypothetical protein